MASPAVACSTANCFAVAIPPSGYAGVPQGGMRPPLRSVRCLPVVASLLPYGTAPDGAFTRRRAEQRTLSGGTCCFIHRLFAPPLHLLGNGFKAYLSNGKETRADVMVAGKWVTVRGLGELIPLDLMSIRYVYPLIIRRLSATVSFLFFDCNGGREDLLKKL